MSLSQRTLRLAACLAAISLLHAAPADAQKARATTAAAVPSQLAPPYRISAGDEVEIYVWGEERLQRVVRVLPDGTFAFPLVGQINAQGKLPADLEAMISERLKDQYRGQVPQVTVSVKTPTGTRFAVVGKVKSPGTFMPGYYVTILDAITLAGGPAEFANMDSILVIRKNGDQQTTLKFRLSQLFKSGAGDDDLRRANVQRIESGDTIIVP